MGADNEPPHRVERLRDLGAMDIMPVGTRVQVAEDGITYTGVGLIAAAITEHIGWPPGNVWMPDHVLYDILRKRGWIIVDPIGAARAVLTHPETVWKDIRSENAACFIVTGDMLREHKLLTSTSTRYVDAIVELRQVPGGNLLRLFHLSPRTRNPRGTRLWP